LTELERIVTLWRSGACPEAERALEALLAAQPHETDALRFRAEIFGATGRTTEAIETWRTLARQHPADAGILRNLGSALLVARAPLEAASVLRAAIDIEPENSRAHNNLGLAQLRVGDLAGAAASLETAVSIEPAYALAHLNLGLAREASGNRAGAQHSYRQALELDPHLSTARFQLSALMRDADASAARREEERALESHALNLMTIRDYAAAIPILTQLLESSAQLNYLEGTLFHCKLQCCDWSAYENTVAALDEQVVRGRPAVLPFSYFVHSDSAARQRQCSQIFAADRHPAQPRQIPPVLQAENGRITIAYLSFDFYEHATAYLIAGLLEAHDRERFTVLAISYGPDDRSAMRLRLHSAVDEFVSVNSFSDLEVAQLLAEHGVQIAVDLKGFTGGARTGILAQRAAPVQVNFLGYPGTMGAPYIDYIIADRHVIPASDRPHYSEQVVELPHCYQPNDPRRPRPVAAPPRESFGLPPQGFVFCCFNNVYKIAPVIFDAWMELLGAVEDSVLWLLEGPAIALANLRSVARARGVRPDRLVFAPHVSRNQHLPRYLHVDLFLDTWPCNAHTTASDALWMGIPLVTLTGQAFPGRVASSLLHAVGLPELCTTSVAQYTTLALRLARDPQERAALQRHLESVRVHCTLFDSASYCRHLETAYIEMWNRHQRAEPPAPLLIGGI
jgi:protein O-GlcNAc transferase